MPPTCATPGFPPGPFGSPASRARIQRTQDHQRQARRIDLGERGIGTLLAHRLGQDPERAMWGDAYTDHGLVFARETGDPIAPESATKTFGRLVHEASLRPVRLHDLRHGRASLMLAAGVPIAVVSKMLGHSSITITSDTYSHLLDGVGRAAADAADALVPALNVSLPEPSHCRCVTSP